MNRMARGGGYKLPSGNLYFYEKGLLVNPLHYYLNPVEFRYKNANQNSRFYVFAGEPGTGKSTCAQALIS